ncbi:hypothetical protein EVAR_29018_1 [Eumeta japonica]|uniref:Uncharacterized protein n=1 Tax=Eumeta variegata TaxID=151549 RepID=A0A4C1W333_EUMVA|nr:hypothetical protein EVAR_29018_1 [Eumeta japonica]
MIDSAGHRRMTSRDGSDLGSCKQYRAGRARQIDVSSDVNVLRRLSIFSFMDSVIDSAAEKRSEITGGLRRSSAGRVHFGLLRNAA